MKILNYTAASITITRFEAEPGQSWYILGSNRSGIEAFFTLLSQDVTNGSGISLPHPSQMGIFSFDGQQALFEEELNKDDTDFMDRIDPGTPARAFLNDPDAYMDIICAFNMDKALDKGYRQLSTGQSRKLLLLSKITRGKKWLLIQAPYDGLDKDSCNELDKALDHCRFKGMGILVFVHNLEDIPAQATHIGVVDNGQLTLSGPRQEILNSVSNINTQADFNASVEELPLRSNIEKKIKHKKELIRLENGSAGYQGKTVFTNLDLTIFTGEHTLISGPNGCGKSTLLQVITGDHPACYTNNLYILGIKRGTGESIWELKKQMGIVSSDLHRNYIVPGSTVDCVLSGLYDSIGLYTTPSPEDEKKAIAWLERINLINDARTPFRDLSYADQRLVLIARALIKLPDLLILDEPTQGLDKANREAILDFLAQIAKENLSTILYVSHREDEFRNFFVSHLQMGQR
ncbi:MAG: ATP-binding cassette domain-containing protein [Desulfobacterales bacterium]|nr:ATP-binding cassette domain-containing protein [Desulfobacterales bacterium]